MLFQEAILCVTVVGGWVGPENASQVQMKCHQVLVYNQLFITYLEHADKDTQACLSLTVNSMLWRGHELIYMAGGSRLAQQRLMKGVHLFIKYTVFGIVSRSHILHSNSREIAKKNNFLHMLIDISLDGIRPMVLENLCVRKSITKVHLSNLTELLYASEFDILGREGSPIIQL